MIEGVRPVGGRGVIGRTQLACGLKLHEAAAIARALPGIDAKIGFVNELVKSAKNYREYEKEVFLLAGRLFSAPHDQGYFYQQLITRMPEGIRPEPGANRDILYRKPRNALYAQGLLDAYEEIWAKRFIGKNP